MDYLSDKVNSLTGDAISGVNEMRRKWKQRRPSGEPSVEQQQRSSSQSTSAMDPNRPIGIHVGLESHQTRGPHASSRGVTRSPLAGGIPFGGDSFTSAPPPPPIGFRADFFSAPPPPRAPTPTTTTTSQPPASPGAGGQVPQQAQQQQQDLSASSESLYQADAWARLWFPRVMVLCLLRMLLFIRKVYEDFQATKVYNLRGQTGFLLISATTLFLPTIVFTLYRVARYLQLALPELRLQQCEGRSSAGPAQQKAVGGRTRTGSTSPAASGPTNDDEAQLRRALMTSSPESLVSGRASATPTGQDDGGLVTARTSPTPQAPLQEEQFHDSHTTTPPPPMPPPRAKQKLESLNVDKLGDLPERESVRIFLGASEQFLHGILFVFWQLKRQVDVMGYLVERACLWRKPAAREKDELNRLRTGSDGLEWFQDFYAAFLAILAQVYMLSAHWQGGRQDPSRPLEGSYIGLGSLPAAGGDGDKSATEPATSSNNFAHIISSFFGIQVLVSGKEGSAMGSGNDVLLVSELVVSSAVILSLLVCVRRRDDGSLTLGLSMLGWGSLFAARIIIIALAFVHIGWHVMLPLVVLHVLLITVWVYSIALASHNDAPSERLDEAQWDEETAIENAARTADEANVEIELGDKRPTSEGPQATSTTTTPQAQQPDAQAQAQTRETSTWSVLEHLVLLTQILTLFAIPSLFYWPIMFNLKLHLRPFKYLVLILIENFVLVPAVWFALGGTPPTPGQLYLLGAVGALSVVGFIFVSLYVACKPSLTEYFARADELFNEAEQSGIYYEFCSRVFKMPDLSKETFRRLMNQSEAVVEQRLELVESRLDEQSDDGHDAGQSERR